MKLSIPAGTTSKRIAIFIQDSSSTTGAGLTGLVFNTSSLSCYSWIDTDGNAGGTSQALQTATRGSWTTRGFIEKDATNLPGMYEFGVPDALIAAGVKWAIIMFKGATNMAPLVLEIEVTAVSNQDAVRGGMTALPNANAEAAGGLYTRGTGAGQIAQDANGNVRVNVDTIKTNPVVNAGTITFPTTATLASTTNITAATGVDITKILGTAISTPATAGILDVNMKNIANAAVSTSSAQIGVNIINAAGTAWNSGAIQLATFAADVGRLSMRSSTATAGGATTITLDAGASAVDNFYQYTTIMITGGTGVGQSRLITSYVGATKVATVPTWATNPDNTSTFAILPGDAETVRTYIGNTPQTGDAYPLISTLKIKKNTALANFPFLMVLTVDHVTPATGLTITATRSLDGAAFGACANAASEISNGMYKISLAAADLNGDTVILKFTGALADQRIIVIATEP